MNIEQHKKQIIRKFKEIDYKDGLILIENIINNNYDKDFIKKIIIRLSKNKKKYTYEIYDYIIENTGINFDTEINYGINIINVGKFMKFIHLCSINIKPSLCLISLNFSIICCSCFSIFIMDLIKYNIND